MTVFSGQYDYCYYARMHLNMIKQMERFARSDQSIISLGQGIPSAPAAAYIHAEVIRALSQASDIDRYSDPLGLPQLRERLAERLQLSDMQYAPHEIMVTAGAIEGINATLQTLITDDKTEVILPSPTYSAYQRAISCAKGTTVPIILQENKNWQLAIADVEAAITKKTAAVLLCNPNNPTGSLYDKQTLIALCRLAMQHHFMLIIDEVYGNMIFDDNELYNPCTNPAFRKHIVRVVSFSKDFSLTGWRIGFLHSDAQVVQRITPIHDTLINCAPVVSQYAAMAALDIYNDVVRRNSLIYTHRRHIMQSYLDDMSQSISYSPAAGGYFLFPKLHISADAHQFCLGLMRHAHVIAIPGDDFGPGGEQHIRLCFGRSAEDIHEGMKRLRNYFLKPRRQLQKIGRLDSGLTGV
jgi:aspartate/methionine/tyrosine aminotransferase